MCQAALTMLPMAFSSSNSALHFHVHVLRWPLPLTAAFTARALTYIHPPVTHSTNVNRAPWYAGTGSGAGVRVVTGPMVLALAREQIANKKSRYSHLIIALQLQQFCFSYFPLPAVDHGLKIRRGQFQK